MRLTSSLGMLLAQNQSSCSVKAWLRPYPILADSQVTQRCQRADTRVVVPAVGSQLTPHRVPQLTPLPLPIPAGLSLCTSQGFLQALPFLFFPDPLPYTAEVFQVRWTSVGSVSGILLCCHFFWLGSSLLMPSLYLYNLPWPGWTDTLEHVQGREWSWGRVWSPRSS